MWVKKSACRHQNSTKYKKYRREIHFRIVLRSTSPNDGVQISKKLTRLNVFFMSKCETLSIFSILSVVPPDLKKKKRQTNPLRSDLKTKRFFDLNIVFIAIITFSIGRPKLLKVIKPTTAFVDGKKIIEWLASANKSWNSRAKCLCVPITTNLIYPPSSVLILFQLHDKWAYFF